MEKYYGQSIGLLLRDIKESGHRKLFDILLKKREMPAKEECKLIQNPISKKKLEKESIKEEDLKFDKRIKENNEEIHKCINSKNEEEIKNKGV